MADKMIVVKSSIEGRLALITAVIDGEEHPMVGKGLQKILDEADDDGNFNIGLHGTGRVIYVEYGELGEGEIIDSECLSFEDYVLLGRPKSLRGDFVSLYRPGGDLILPETSRFRDWWG